MAIRNVALEGEDILRKKSKTVEVLDEKIKTLIEDMWETMYKHEGIGLAAPQVGILKRVIVYDIGEGKHALINPEIISSSGEQWCEETCLSILNKSGEVCRPAKVRVKGIDENFKEVEFEATKLLAICLSHEIDHLYGILYIDKADKIYNISENGKV